MPKRTTKSETDAGQMFRFRAECAFDAIGLLQKCRSMALVAFAMKQQLEPFPDVECRIQVKGLGLEGLRSRCRKVRDGHVMLQTIQPEESYTGERDYTLQ